jgi:hypothetical protein
MSLHARRLRSPLPEARSGQCLSVSISHWIYFTGGPGLCPRSMREARGADRWRNPVYVLIIGWRTDGRGSCPELVIFRLVAPPLQPKVVGPFPGMGVWFPIIYCWREPIVSKFLSRNRWPTVYVLFTPTVAPEPSIEWVAGASHSTVGRTGSHMVLWALPRGSTVRLRG